MPCFSLIFVLGMFCASYHRCAYYSRTVLLISTCASNSPLIYLQFCWVSRPTILITFGAIFRMSRLWATLSGERPEGPIWLVRYLNIPLFNMSIGNFHRRRKFIFSLLDGGFTIVSENIFTTAETFPGSFLERSERRRNQWISLGSSKQNT